MIIPEKISIFVFVMSKEGKLKTTAIIMSVYINDKVEHLKESIDSIIEQTVDSWILVIKVDGPITNTVWDLLKAYSNTNSNIQVISREENRGLAVSLNELIDYVIETYPEINFIARMDADDICMKNRIESQENYLKKNKQIDVLGTACLEFGSNFSKLKNCYLTHEDIAYYKFKKCPFIHPTVMFNVRIFKDGNKYPINTTLSEDIAFWFLLIRKGYTMGNLPEPLLKYRTSEEMINRRRGFKKAISEFNIKVTEMIVFRELSFKNFYFACGFLLLRISPSFVNKLAYKYLRN